MNIRSRRIVTLTTDFGSSDSYVAQMKGVILTISPNVTLVDVTHDVPAQDVRRGAMLLSEIIEAFPPGTIHLCVVDPGVGSERRIVAVEMNGHGFVAPDNGVLGDLADASPPTCVVTIEQSLREGDQPTSTTFQGRDVMAPAAAHWAGGAAITDLGTESTTPLVRLPAPLLTIAADEIRGEIVWIDRFGNAVTSIPADALAIFARKTVAIGGGKREIASVSRFYAEHAEGEPLALIGSSGKLEISVRNGHAAEQLQLTRGMVVTVGLKH